MKLLVPREAQRAQVEVQGLADPATQMRPISRRLFLPKAGIAVAAALSGMLIPKNGSAQLIDFMPFGRLDSIRFPDANPFDKRFEEPISDTVAIFFNPRRPCIGKYLLYDDFPIPNEPRNERIDVYRKGIGDTVEYTFPDCGIRLVFLRNQLLVRNHLLEIQAFEGWRGEIANVGIKLGFPLSRFLEFFPEAQKTQTDPLEYSVSVFPRDENVTRISYGIVYLTVQIDVNGNISSLRMYNDPHPYEDSRRFEQPGPNATIIFSPEYTGFGNCHIQCEDMPELAAEKNFYFYDGHDGGVGDTLEIISQKYGMYFVWAYGELYRIQIFSNPTDLFNALLWDKARYYRDIMTEAGQETAYKLLINRHRTQHLQNIADASPGFEVWRGEIADTGIKFGSPLSRFLEVYPDAQRSTLNPNAYSTVITFKTTPLHGMSYVAKGSLVVTVDANMNINSIQLFNGLAPEIPDLNELSK